MIFLSAQPDSFYFLWQLQLQFYNFELNNIDPKDIHALVGYDPLKGLSKEWKDFLKANSQFGIYTYPDTREKSVYPSSIRPHLIAKHFITYPILQKKTIFYHDSDMIFKELPNIKSLQKNKNWYASDTKAYLDSNYIKRLAGEVIFQLMCEIVGVTPKLVEENDSNAGGAQYILKNVGVDFWKKVENDCERMYSLLVHHNAQAGVCNDRPLIQSWCADMWVIWWNALFFKKKFKIHSDLNFAWADSDIKQLDKCKILHYTGSLKKRNTEIFRKSDYVNYSPFNKDLSYIGSNSCSSFLRDVIYDYSKKKMDNRSDLLDVSFLIFIRVDSESRLENLYAVIENLSNHYNTNIILMEVDDNSKIDLSRLSAQVKYYFVEDHQKRLHHTKFINQMLLKATTPYISIYDSDIILPKDQIVESVKLLRNEKISAVSPYDGNFVHVDPLMKAMFLKIHDVKFLEENINKLNSASKRSYGGAIFLNKEAYLDAGLENENLFAWGPNDIERIKRLKILGYNAKRIKGNLFHLHHSRGINTGYQTISDQEKLMGEYLKICNSYKSNLRKYVDSWIWKKKAIKLLSK